MKKMVQLIGIACFAMVTVLTAAQTLPITSQDVLRQYAMSQGATGGIYYDCTSANWNYSGTKSNIQVKGSSGEEIMAELAQFQYVLDIRNTNDIVVAYAYIYDTDQNLLVYGYGSALPGQPMNVQYWIQGVPLPITVSAATVLVVGDDGKTAYQYPVRLTPAGRPVLSSVFAGASNGILAVTYPDGSGATFNLFDTGSAPDSVTTVSASMSLPGHYVLTDPSTVKIIELWNRPSVFLTLSADRMVSFDVSGYVYEDGGYFEHPSAVVDLSTLRKDGSYATYDLTKVPAAGFVAGQHRLVFVWNRFAQNQLGVPVDGGSTSGGKG